MKKIRLDLSEMSIPPPLNIRNKMKDTIDNINRYTPQEEVDILKKLLSDYANVNEKNLFLSSASDIILKEFIFLIGQNRKIISLDPTFILIKNAIQKVNSDSLFFRLREPKFQLKIEPLINELDKPTLLIFDNPNNPTGSLVIGEEELKKLLDLENTICLVDEAYFEFSNTNFGHLINKYPNLAVLRTVSKSFALAGDGIGYLLMGKKIKKRFEGLEIKLPHPGVIGATYALQNRDYMEKYVRKVKKERDRMYKKLSNLKLEVFPSQTNFLLLKTNHHNIVQQLAQKDIFVSDVSAHLGSGYIRVSIGNADENEAFLKQLKKIVGEK